MRSPRHMGVFMAAIATLLTAVTAAVAASSSSAASSGAWCTNTAKVVLTTCGSECNEDQPCAQYPAQAAARCSNAARNDCVPYDDACTYQCLETYNFAASKWTLFVKDPKTSDAFSADTAIDTFPAAPIDEISGFQFSDEIKQIQITGFANATVLKGSTKNLKLDDDIFEKASIAEFLALSNIDLSKIPTNFLPPSVANLILENCKLSDVPSDVGNMVNINSLNIAKNSIQELPSVDSKITKALQELTTLDLRENDLTSFDWVLPELTTLDLSDNKIAAFPPALFNLTKLATLNLAGNPITNLTLTPSEFSILKRLSSDSKLGISSATGSCLAGQTEDKVLDSVVCIATAEVTPAPSSGSSSNTIVIAIAVVTGVLIVAGIGFFLYRRRSKAKAEFYVSVMDPSGNANHTGNTTGNSRSGVYTRGSRAQSGTRGSLPSGGGRTSGPLRPSGPSSRPSKSAFGTGGTGGYSEISKYQEELQRDTGALSQPVVSRQRERAQINQNVVRIASNDINYTRTIAKGAFGEVWLAHLGRDLIAVKKLLASDAGSVGDFVAELNLLASLSHPRILALVGACWDDEFTDLQIITEYMDSGDLLSVLRRNSPTEFTWENGKAAYCLQVCEAVYYLHSLQPALIHRDIKSRNILVDSRKGAKLSDFGESRERTIQNTMTAGVGTARWVAPEIILGEDYSELADIYSLGVLLTELDTHMIPFENMGLEEAMIVQQVAVGKLRPKVSETCPEVIVRLTHECLQFDPQLRPSAARVLQTLMSSPLVKRLSTISDNSE